MKIGVGLPNQVRNVRPVVIPEWASRAEKAEFSTLGSVGRVAYPGVMDTVALAASAGATSTIGLISNILIAPAWPPVLLAKEAAGIDAVSGGRLRSALVWVDVQTISLLMASGPRGPACRYRLFRPRRR